MTGSEGRRVPAVVLELSWREGTILLGLLNSIKLGLRTEIVGPVQEDALVVVATRMVDEIHRQLGARIGTTRIGNPQPRSARRSSRDVKAKL